MRLRGINLDPILASNLSKYVEIAPNSDVKSDVCFIDHCLDVANDVAELFEKTILNKIPTIVFDRDLSLSNKQIRWLLNFKNVILCEPAINCRSYFEYLPFWIDQPKNLPLIDFSHKTIDLYEMNNNSSLFYSNFLGKFPNYITGDNLNTSKLVLLYPTEKEAKIGYLPDISKILQAYCLPVIYKTHRYYHAAFPIIKTELDLQYHLELYNTANWACISTIYMGIDHYFPEMNVDNVSKKIMNLFKEIK